MSAPGQAGGSGPKEDYLDKGNVSLLLPFLPSLFPFSRFHPSITHIYTGLTAKTKKPGLDAAEKKFGQGKVDPVKQRETNEKVTDKARGLFEKVTG